MTRSISTTIAAVFGVLSLVTRGDSVTGLRGNDHDDHGQPEIPKRTRTRLHGGSRSGVGGGLRARRRGHEEEQRVGPKLHGHAGDILRRRLSDDSGHDKVRSI